MEKIEIKIIGSDEIDEHICECGNTVMDAGFYPCDIDGNTVEPTESWQGLYKCENCGAMHYIKQ